MRIRSPRLLALSKEDAEALISAIRLGKERKREMPADSFELEARWAMLELRLEALLAKKPSCQ